MVIMKNWFTVADPYAAPEVRSLKLAGNVYGHPRKADGHKVQTSNIIAIHKSPLAGVFVVECESRDYAIKTGEESSEWLAWMSENGVEYDRDNPIKIRS